MSRRRRLVGSAIATALVAGSIAVAVPQAQALNNVLCDAAGNVYVTHSAGTISMTVSGIGRCGAGDDGGPYITTFSGSGSAVKVGGNCSSGLPLVTALKLKVHVHLQSVSSGNTENFTLAWSLAISTFPQISEFLAYQSGKLQGAGTIETAKTVCEGDRNSSGALFDFDFVNGLPI